MADIHRNWQTDNCGRSDFTWLDRDHSIKGITVTLHQSNAIQVARVGDLGG